MKHLGIATQILAENLSKLMQEHGLSLRRLSAMSGVGEGTIARMRNGTHAATLDSLQLVADFFELEPWQLLVEHLDVDNPPVVQKYNTNKR